MNQEKDYATAERLIARSEKDVQIGDHLYRIRGISSQEVLVGLRSVVDVSAIGNESAARAHDEKRTLEQAARQMAAVLGDGLLIPRLGEDGLELRHIPFFHQQQLFAEIMDLSGVNLQAAQRTAPFGSETSVSLSMPSAVDMDDSHRSS